MQVPGQAVLCRLGINVCDGVERVIYGCALFER